LPVVAAVKTVLAPAAAWPFPTSPALKPASKAKAAAQKKNAGAQAAPAASALKTVLAPAAAWPFPTSTRPS
jgi:hypothetical protein